MKNLNKYMDPNTIESYKKKIFDNVKDNTLTYEDVLGLDPETDDVNNNDMVKKAQNWCASELALKNLGLSSWREVNDTPDSFKVIKKVSFSEEENAYPKKLYNSVGDEITIALLDFETTGLDHDRDKVIELGLVILKYSPSIKVITSIDRVVSRYNDPDMPISEKIQKITGIKDEDVKGKSIDLAEVSKWLENEKTYIIAHNAKFDRPFFHNLMLEDNYRWGCSVSQIDWSQYEEYRIESAKLEYILLKLGYFYKGHRASTDCLAMVQMFLTLPQALEELINNIDYGYSKIKATKVPFEAKDDLKIMGFRWDATERVWWIEVPESKSEDTLNNLNSLNNYSSTDAEVTTLTAKDRFKREV
jgi:DNA polymerase-3 subunit epsilon